MIPIPSAIVNTTRRIKNVIVIRRTKTAIGTSLSDFRSNIEFICLTGMIRIPRPGDIRQESLTGEKGEIVGGSRFFAGKGAWIRRVEGLEGNREKGIASPLRRIGNPQHRNFARLVKGDSIPFSILPVPERPLRQLLRVPADVIPRPCEMPLPPHQPVPIFPLPQRPRASQRLVDAPRREPLP